jgi:hypothetical protein
VRSEVQVLPQVAAGGPRLLPRFFPDNSDIRSNPSAALDLQPDALALPRLVDHASKHQRPIEAREPNTPIVLDVAMRMYR